MVRAPALPRSDRSFHTESGCAASDPVSPGPLRRARCPPSRPGQFVLRHAILQGFQGLPMQTVAAPVEPERARLDQFLGMPVRMRRLACGPGRQWRRARRRTVRTSYNTCYLPLSRFLLGNISFVKNRFPAIWPSPAFDCKSQLSSKPGRTSAVRHGRSTPEGRTRPRIAWGSSGVSDLAREPSMQFGVCRMCICILAVAKPDRPPTDAAERLFVHEPAWALVRSRNRSE